MINNGALPVVSNIICNVILSSADTTTVALYLNEKDGVLIRNTLEEMGHPQPETPLKTYKYTPEVIVNISIVQRCSKVMGMSFYFLLNWENQILERLGFKGCGPHTSYSVEAIHGVMALNF